MEKVSSDSFPYSWVIIGIKCTGCGILGGKWLFCLSTFIPLPRAGILVQILKVFRRQLCMHAFGWVHKSLIHVRSVRGQLGLRLSFHIHSILPPHWPPDSESPSKFPFRILLSSYFHHRSDWRKRKGM